MELKLVHPTGLSVDVTYNGDLVQDGGRVTTTPTFGGDSVVDYRSWAFTVTVNGDHGERPIREVGGGAITLVRGDGVEHPINCAAPQLMSLPDGKILKLTAMEPTIEAFLVGD